MSSGKWRPFCLGLNVLTHMTYALLLSHMDDLLTHPNAVGILLLSHMDDLLTHPNAVGILLLSDMDDLLTHPNAVGILLLSHMDDLLTHPNAVGILLLSHMDDLLTHPNAVGILLLSHMDDLLTHPNAVGILLLSHMDDLLTHPNAVGILLLSHMDDLLTHPNAVGILLLSHMDDLLSHALDFSTVYLDIFAIWSGRLINSSAWHTYTGVMTYGWASKSSVWDRNLCPTDELVNRPYDIPYMPMSFVWDSNAPLPYGGLSHPYTYQLYTYIIYGWVSKFVRDDPCTCVYVIRMV